MTFALRAAACWAPSPWLWGVDVFRHWPPAWQWALIALAAAGFLPPLGRGLERVLERWGRLWHRAGARADLVASLVVGLALFFLRDPIRFTGDSAMRAGLVQLPADAAARLMVLYFPLDPILNLQLPRWLVEQGLTADTALHLVGALVGGAFAFVSCSFLRAAGGRGAAFSAAAAVVLASGAFVHFAGYDKFGPLMLGLALTATGALRLSRGQGGLATLAVGGAACMLSHRSGYAILPAVAWTLYRAWRVAPNAAARSRILLAGAVIAAPALVLLPKAVELVTRVDRQVHLPGGEITRAREAGDAPWILSKLADGLNVLSLLVPLWLAGAVAAGIAAQRKSAPRAAGFGLMPLAALGLGASVALVLAIAPGGGWPRDWDAAAGLGAVATLATGGALVAAWSRVGTAWTAAPAVTLALAVSIGFWGVHASESIGLRRIDSLLASSAWSDSRRANAYDVLSAHAMNSGRWAQAEELMRRAIASAPNPRYFHQLGVALAALGRWSEAETQFREAARRNDAVADPWVALSRLALARGDTATAVALADSAVARGPRNPDVREIAARLAPFRRPPP